MIGDHLSREAERKLKIWGHLVMVLVYVIGAIVTYKSIYGAVSGPMFLGWVGGLSLYDSQENRRRQQLRQSARTHNFGLPAGLTGRLRPDPHPARQIPEPNPTPVAWNPETRVWIAVHNPGASVVERIEVPKPVRVSRYERISDPAKWVI